MAKEKSGVSILFWIFAIFVTRLPCVGTMISIPFAFFGENESRKNFFKAALLIDLVALALIIIFTTLGALPQLLDLAKQAVDHFPKYLKGS